MQLGRFQTKQWQVMRGYARPVSLGVWVFAAAAISGFSALLVYMDQYEKGQLGENKSINFKQLMQDAASIEIPGNKTDAQIEKQTAPAEKHNQAVAAVKKPVTEKSSEDKKEHKPKFDFYSLLPEMEVIVPESALPLRPAKRHECEVQQSADQQTAKQQTTTQQSVPAKQPVRAAGNAGYPTVAKPLTGDNHYFIQAGAFKDIKLADRRKASLALIGIKSSIVSVDLKSRGVWHRVRVGPFEDMGQIRKVRSVMQSNNISSITVKVKS